MPGSDLEAVVTERIDEFSRADWDRCFPGELEAFDYYRAVEEAGLADFTLRYIALSRQGRPIVLAPFFITDYRLDTTVQGAWKQVTATLSKAMPRLLALRLICLGSPVGEVCHLGFAPEVAAVERRELLRRLLDAFEAEAARLGVGLIGIKDAPARDDALWQSLFDLGYQRLPSLPTAVLALPYRDEQHYLASLSAATRKDMRRKLKSAAAIRVERRRNIDDVLDQVMALYEQTLARSDLQFERLPPAYFTNVLRHLGPHASCYLYWHGERLAAFNLLLHDERRLIDKFLGLHGELGRAYNLYYLSWFTNVRTCIAEGIPCYQSGQAGYGPKRRLGSRLEPNWLYFRHRRPWLNQVLRLVGRLVRLDRFDPELQQAARGTA